MEYWKTKKNNSNLSTQKQSLSSKTLKSKYRVQNKQNKNKQGHTLPNDTGDSVRKITLQLISLRSTKLIPLNRANF